MALFNMKSTGSGDSFLWDKFNHLITILNRWADTVNTYITALNTFMNITIGYAAGTFLPTVYGATTAGTWTYTTQEGEYVKVGRQVTFSIRVKIATVSGSPTGSLAVGNLPYATSSMSARTYVVMSDLVSWGTGPTTIVAYHAASGSFFTFYGLTNNATWTNVPVGNIVAGDSLIISGSYLTA